MRTQWGRSKDAHNLSISTVQAQAEQNLSYIMRYAHLNALEKALGTRLISESPPSCGGGVKPKIQQFSISRMPTCVCTTVMFIYLCSCRGENQVLNVNALINKLTIVSLSLYKVFLCGPGGPECDWKNNTIQWRVSVILYLFCFSGRGVVCIPWCLLNGKLHFKRVGVHRLKWDRITTSHQFISITVTTCRTGLDPC